MTKVLRLVDVDLVRIQGSGLFTRYSELEAPEVSEEYKRGYIAGYADCRQDIMDLPAVRLSLGTNNLDWIARKDHE